MCTNLKITGELFKTMLVNYVLLGTIICIFIYKIYLKYMVSWEFSFFRSLFVITLPDILL
jgi:hypothetical protein